MAGAAHKSKTSEITDRINVFGASLKDDGKFDMLEWQRLRRDLEELEAIPAHRKTALMLLAVVWEFKHDREKIQALLNQAAGKFGKDLNWYLTRANMAPTFGDTTLITDMLEHSYPKGSKAGLDKVVSMCSHSGMFSSAVRALDDLIKLDERQGRALEEEYPFLRPASNYLEIHDIPELEVANRVVAASKVVIDSQFRLTRYSVRSDVTGLMFEFTIDGEIDRLVEVDLAISDAIATQFEGTLSQHLSIGVSPKEEAA
ncbi:hypothetical protein [Pseudomonas palleroniana]|uniref:hypothetical protein n=1 Tax=Pseudomonas palleroniana TaxID=191390 RepID=UPI0018E6AB3E|nr:hypothetical protein [Pseudomonas palleroniana]MBI6911035.1 hypothetical protein [Pseudomonas palleroniana]